MDSPHIRKYIPSDKPRLQSVCMQTADDFYKKRPRLLHALPTIYNDYFTENESDNIFVLADGNNNAVGYIICSSDYNKFISKYRSVYLRRLTRSAPELIPVLLSYLICLIMIKSKPAHLHIDLLPEYQRKGWGTKLIDALRSHLNSQGISALSVCCVSRGSPGYKMYKKYGFSEFYTHAPGMVSLCIATEKSV